MSCPGSVTIRSVAREQRRLCKRALWFCLNRQRNFRRSAARPGSETRPYRGSYDTCPFDAEVR